MTKEEIEELKINNFTLTVLNEQQSEVIERLLEENKNIKKLLDQIRNITYSYVPLNAGDIISNIKDYIDIIKNQKEILEVLKRSIKPKYENYFTTTDFLVKSDSELKKYNILVGYEIEFSKYEDMVKVHEWKNSNENEKTE